MTVCAGVDGCKGGWIVVWRGDGLLPEVQVFKRLEDLVAMLTGDAVIAVDIPIGLPDQIVGAGRVAEQAIRKLLPGKTSSVFSVPSREAIEKGARFLEIHPYEKAYDLTKQVAAATSVPSRTLSRQSFGILPKIAEVDALLRSDESLPLRILESHPEAVFCLLNGGTPMSRGKMTAEGAAQRRVVLEGKGFSQGFLSSPAPSGAKTDDFLDACAMLLVAESVLLERDVPHPSPPGRDKHNLPVAIRTPG
jgi:predicted RNase H-like nuclease